MKQIAINYYGGTTFTPRIHNRRKPICATFLARLVGTLTGHRKPTLADVKPLPPMLPAGVTWKGVE